MPLFSLHVLLSLAGWTTQLVASDSDFDQPLPDHHAPDNLFGLRMGILPHVLLGAEPYSSHGYIPWTSSDVSDVNRTGTLSYGVRVGTFYAISNSIVVGLEVPYLTRSHTPADEANPSLHPSQPKLGYPDHEAVVSLDLHF